MAHCIIFLWRTALEGEVASTRKTGAECSTQTFSLTVASPLIKEGDMPDRDVTELATFKNLVERHWKAEVSLAG